MDILGVDSPQGERPETGGLYRKLVLLKAMEPIMIVVLGVVVGGMIVAMYLPIFDMINAVK